MQPTDAWGRIFHYRVEPEFTGPPVPAASPPAPANQMPAPCSAESGVGSDCGMGVCDLPDLTMEVRTRRSTDKSLVSLVGPTLTVGGAAAVVVSFGPNGYGGTDFASGQVFTAPPSIGTDEAENLEGKVGSGVAGTPNGVFISRTRTLETTGCSDTAVGSPFCEFDDQVTWISAPVLFARMVAGGNPPPR